MKKVLLKSLALNESNILSTSERLGVKGGACYCPPPTPGDWKSQSDYMFCMASCGGNGGTGNPCDCAGPDVPCDPDCM